MREAKAGFRRADVALRPVTKLIRAPLPAALAWRLATAALSAMPSRRRRLKALVIQFWWMRRPGDITRLRLQDVDVRADGSTHYKVPRHKTEARAGLIARTMPAWPGSPLDLPHVLLRQLVSEDRAAGRPPSAYVFVSCAAQGASALLTTWLRQELALLGASPPVGTYYASHSLKAGDATAAHAAGVPRGMVAALSATTERTLATSYISPLVTPSDYDRYLFARLRPG